MTGGEPTLWDLVKWALAAMMGGLGWWIRGVSKKADDTKDDLAAYKLEVAQKYVSVGYLQDVERRLVARSDQTDAKIDKLDAKLDRLLTGKHGGGDI